MEYVIILIYSFITNTSACCTFLLASKMQTYAAMVLRFVEPYLWIFVRSITSIRSLFCELHHLLSPHIEYSILRHLRPFFLFPPSTLCSPCWWVVLGDCLSVDWLIEINQHSWWVFEVLLLCGYCLLRTVLISVSPIKDRSSTWSIFQATVNQYYYWCTPVLQYTPPLWYCCIVQYCVTYSTHDNGLQYSE